MSGNEEACGLPLSGVEWSRATSPHRTWGPSSGSAAVASVCLSNSCHQPEILSDRKQMSPSSPGNASSWNSQGEASEMMLDEASTMSASNINERGDVWGTFSVGKALVLCMSGGSAAKHGVCGVAPPWWAGQVQTPMSSSVLRGRSRRPVDSEGLRGAPGESLQNHCLLIAVCLQMWLQVSLTTRSAALRASSCFADWGLLEGERPRGCFV